MATNEEEVKYLSCLVLKRSSSRILILRKPRRMISHVQFSRQSGIELVFRCRWNLHFKETNLPTVNRKQHQQPINAHCFGFKWSYQQNMKQTYFKDWLLRQRRNNCVWSERMSWNWMKVFRFTFCFVLSSSILSCFKSICSILFCLFALYATMHAPQLSYTALQFFKLSFENFFFICSFYSFYFLVLLGVFGSVWCTWGTFCYFVAVWIIF